MRKHLKYIFITIIALLTVFVGGGLSYFYFSPVDGASFDKDIGIDTSTDQIYENYSFSNEKDKDHSYTLYFFPSVYYMGIYKAYLDDPVHNPKPEEAFGSFEIESDDVLRIPKKDPNNTNFYKINNFEPKGLNVGGTIYNSYTDLMTAKVKDASFYPFSKNDYTNSVYPTATNATPAFRNSGTMVSGKNDRYGGWGDYDSKVVVSSLTNKTIYEGGMPKISTPGTNEKYVDRRYLPLKLNVKYSISLNEFNNYINYPVVNFAAENQGMETNTNHKWTVAKSKKLSNGNYSLVSDYSDVNTSFFASDKNTFFNFDEDLNNYVTKIEDLPDSKDSHVIRIFPQFKETKNVGKIASNFPSSDLPNSGRDCAFIIGRNSTGSSTTKLWRTFDYVGDNYVNNGSNKYGTNKNVYLATGREIDLSDDYSSIENDVNKVSTLRVDPAIFNGTTSGQYAGHKLAFKFIKNKSSGVDYSKKHINLYALVTNSGLCDSSAQSLVSKFGNNENLLLSLTNDKENFPTLYKKDLQTDFSKIGFKVTNEAGNVTNEAVFYHTNYPSTSYPATGYIFLCYELIDDLHLYKDSYSNDYLANSSKDLKTFYNDYFKNNYDLTRTFSRVNNCYVANTDEQLNKAISGTGEKVNDTNPNVLIYRNADFTNIRYIYGQLASYQGQVNNSSIWLETSNTKYERLYYKEINGNNGRVFTRIDPSFMEYTFYNENNRIDQDLMLGLKFLTNRAKSIYDILLVRRADLASTMFSSFTKTVDGYSRTFNYYYDLYICEQEQRFVKIFDGEIDLGTVKKVDKNNNESSFINHYTTTNLIFEKDYLVGDMMSSKDEDKVSSSTLISILKNKYGSNYSRVFLYDYTTKKKVLSVDLTSTNEGISIRSYEAPSINSSSYEVELDSSGNISLLYFYRILNNKILYCLPSEN